MEPRSAAGNFIAQIAQGLFSLIDQAIGSVFRVDQFAALLIFSFMLARFLHHAIDIALVQVGRSSDR